MNWRVLVHLKPTVADHHGDHIRRESRLAGLAGVARVRAGHAYELQGNLSEKDARFLADRVLADPVTQEAAVYPADHVRRPQGGRLAEIWLKQGVADPVADTVRLAARDAGLEALTAVRSGQVVDFFGSVTPAALRRFCEDHLMNPLVQTVEVL